MNSKKDGFSVDNIFEFPRLCRYLSERSPQPMVAVEGLTHIVSYVNPAFCALVGKTRDDLIDRPFSVAVPEGDRNGCSAILERVFRTGEAELLAEQPHGEKTNCYWSYSLWAILNAEEEPAGVMIQITDSSEAAAFRKRAVGVNEALVVSSMRQHELTGTAVELNKELQAATLIKNQFLAAMSHEIRTPLNAIMGFSELLALSDQTKEDRYIYGQRMKRNAVLLLRLINDILDLSKVESGNLLIEKIDVNLPELFSDVDMVMRHLAEEKGIAFSMTMINPIPDIVATDPTRLKQILTNVIGNAIKFTTVGSVRLTVAADHMNKKLCFVVSDTGEGMTATQASKIFFPFIQGDASTTRKYGGTGLGLDLARRLAEALGGNVLLLESVPQKGSVFEIIVALENARYKGDIVESSKQMKENFRRLDGINILLAEDAPDNQLLMTRFLTRAGARVAVAHDGEVAVSMAQVGSYDIVLMDIQMPKIDGYAATTRLREYGYKGTIVALTAHAMRNEIEHCRFVGCDAHLSKPVGMHELCELIHKLVVEKNIKSCDGIGRRNTERRQRGDLLRGINGDSHRL
jgi:PAS domain S-box-containing protein